MRWVSLPADLIARCLLSWLVRVRVIWLFVSHPLFPSLALFSLTILCLSPRSLFFSRSFPAEPSSKFDALQQLLNVTEDGYPDPDDGTDLDEVAMFLVDAFGNFVPALKVRVMCQGHVSESLRGLGLQTRSISSIESDNRVGSVFFSARAVSDRVSLSLFLQDFELMTELLMSADAPPSQVCVVCACVCARVLRLYVFCICCGRMPVCVCSAVCVAHLCCFPIGFL